MLSPLNPETQIAFAVRLGQIESEQLAGALGSAVKQADLTQVDADLTRLVPPRWLSTLASLGFRGEIVFATPTLLGNNPRLLGYYRLLLGISQKEFNRLGYGRFAAMENGQLSSSATAGLEQLCVKLCDAASLLLEYLELLSLELVRDLQLLTLGAQLRGSKLNELGRAAVAIVFRRVRAAIANDAVLDEGERHITIRNSSGRVMQVQFSSDPDIAVTETLSSSTRHVLAIEVKGGTDRSNIHNRIGEAEKSHQKARLKGFTEFWTIINVAVDPDVAKAESPTTNRFFNLDEMINPSHAQWIDFRDALTSRLSVPAS